MPADCPDAWTAVLGGCYRTTQLATASACQFLCGQNASMACMRSAAQNDALSHFAANDAVARKGLRRGQGEVWIGNVIERGTRFLPGCSSNFTGLLDVPKRFAPERGYRCNP